MTVGALRLPGHAAQPVTLRGVSAGKGQVQDSRAAGRRVVKQVQAIKTDSLEERTPS